MQVCVLCPYSSERMADSTLAARSGLSHPESTGATKEIIWRTLASSSGMPRERRACIIRERGIYNQDYCGCEFSGRG